MSALVSSVMSTIRLSGEEHDADGGLALQESKPEVKKPPLFKVVLLNDDYTPMDFVVMILQDVFHKNHDEATYIMLMVHTKDVGCCGAYPYAIAEAKVSKVMDLARSNGHPLLCTMEPE